MVTGCKLGLLYLVKDYSVQTILTTGIILTITIMVLNQTIDVRANQEEQEDSPNILLIMADDVGFSDIGPFGSEISTPNIERLARDGQMLTNFHVLPACSPTRSEILTGVDNHLNGLGTMFETITPNQAGIQGYETFLNDRVVTVAESLRNGGYNTILSGKWHLSWQGEPINGKYISEPSTKGFENSFTLLGPAANHFNGSGLCDQCIPPTFLKNGKMVERPDGIYSSNLYTDEMISFITEMKDDRKPMFMYLALQAAHVPMEAPKKLINKYLGKYIEGWDPIKEERFERGQEIGIWAPEMKMPERFPPDPEWNSTSSGYRNYWTKNMATHAAMVENMDSNVGRLINYLKEIGEYDNTLILFTSDDGGTNASLGLNTVEVSPLSGGKGSMYEGGIRSPLVIKKPTTPHSDKNDNTSYLKDGTMNDSASTAVAVAGAGADGNNSSTFNTKPDYNIIKSFIHALDLVPTFLDYGGISATQKLHVPTVLEMYSGSVRDKEKETYQPTTGRSIRPLLEDSSRDIHGNIPISQELFGNSAVFMGHWKLVKHNPPAGDGKWRLYDIMTDPAETNNLATKDKLQIIQRMLSAYKEYSKSVNIIPPDMNYFPMEIFGTLPNIYSGTHNDGKPISADIAR